MSVSAATTTATAATSKDLPQLVLIETSGNQAYVFQSNRLKEMVGASELTWQCGVRWIGEAICAITGKKFNGPHRDWLVDAANNPPFASGGKVEAIQLTSGKALLIVDCAETAKTIISTVTRRALHEAPGLDVCGFFVPLGDVTSASAIGTALEALYQGFAEAKMRRPSVHARFPMQPVLMPCNSTGLPAEGEYDRKVLSRSAIAKRVAKKGWEERWLAMLAAIAPETKQEPKTEQYWYPTVSKDMEVLAEGWIALVHADGNGLGELFINFATHFATSVLAKAATSDCGRALLNAYRNFSIEVEAATEAAFCRACAKLQLSKQTFRDGNDRQEPVLVKPILPLILGGDDLTVLVDGEQAIAFTENYLRAFELESAKQPTIIAIRTAAKKPPYLSACAGISIFGNHYPLHLAYDLAEALCKSAKTVKKHSNCHSAFDVHPIYDSGTLDLDGIRAQLRPKNEVGTQLFRRPFVLAQAGTELPPNWLAVHDWQCCVQRIQAILQQKDDRRALPNKLLHELRSLLFEGSAQADAYFKLMQGKHRALIALAEAGNSLFSGSNTLLIDALELAPFYALTQESTS